MFKSFFSNKVVRGVLVACGVAGLGLGASAVLNNNAAVTANSFGFFVTYLTGLMASDLTLALAIGAVMVALFIAFMGGQMRAAFVSIALVLIVALLVPSIVTNASTSLPTAEMLQLIVK